MKKIIIVTCLILLATGSASVWASAMCPSEHHMVTMRPAHDCPAAACCAVSAPLTAEYPGKARPESPAATSGSAHAPVAKPAAVIAAEHGCPATPCLGLSQASLVLRL